ncbi:glutamate-cysteine ligase-domain-containing protein [Gorgonomyces haynaldii]|nr:glutamate-cysteine ligase-domain-containing protein [Gorgonomyces haynaldii]
MGLLSLGTPLDWPDVPQYADKVRKNGIQQFLNQFHKLKARTRDQLLWGDEVEYCVIQFHDNEAKLSLEAYQTLDLLQQRQDTESSSWHVEFGRYMLEGTPNIPYGHTIKDFLSVEDNMRARRSLAASLLPPDQALMTLTHFPRLGAGQWSVPYQVPSPLHGYSQSLFLNDNVIGLHPRFRTLAQNIRKRRGSKVAINVPIFRDTNTPWPFREPIPDYCTELFKNHGIHAKTLDEYCDQAKPNHIYMDAMAFGMGSSCLQVTFQACTIEQARLLYDQLACLTPVMLALSASSPIYRGYLADVDCRWNVIAGSVDDRTPQELGKEPLKTDRFVMHKSRYDSISRFLSTGPNYSGGCSGLRSGDLQGTEYFKPEYNDIPFSHDPEIYDILVSGGVDDLLAKHYAHLFIRDPLVVYKELVDQDNENSMDHFENLQSTNWQTMRFKPPPLNSQIGWRVEFRSMDLQLSDHENAAFAIFIVLLARTIIKYDLNFYQPLSQVDLNMQRAQQRDAVHGQKFWFRTVVHPKQDEGSSFDLQEFQELSVNEIMNGTQHNLGVVQLVDRYLDETEMEEVTRLKLKRYTNLVRQKASGKRQTGAVFMRQFVLSHPDYKQDSVVSPKINHDLCKRILDLHYDDLLQ